MPSKSRAQQQAMGIALAAQRGLIPRSKLRGPARRMMSMTESQLSDFAKGPTAGKPLHTPKKWWGGPLAGFAPWQSQGQAVGRGLGQLAMPGGPPPAAQTSVAPMMPSLSGLMAPPSGGLMPPVNPGSMPRSIPGMAFAEGGLAGAPASKSKIPPDTMMLKSQLGLSRLPDDFYYMKGINPKNKLQNFVPPSPREQQEINANPEQFGHPVAGLLHSEVPGRTDQLPISVASNSYVVPADVISGLGQGNTTAGAKMFLDLLGKYPGVQGMAEGGVTADKPTIPIVAAGGEYVVPPSTVVNIGNGDVLKGHAILDKFVLSVRGSVADRLRKLPPPRRD